MPTATIYRDGDSERGTGTQNAFRSKERMEAQEIREIEITSKRRTERRGPRHCQVQGGEDGDISDLEKERWRQEKVRTTKQELPGEYIRISWDALKKYDFHLVTPISFIRLSGGILASNLQKLLRCQPGL
jgi:hypothetical protein